jgi:tetratricopeptide (TPR) repeat protein
MSYAKQQQFDKAHQHYTHALEVDPSFVHAYVARGAAYVLQHQWANAVTSFQEALRRDPEASYAAKYLAAAQDKLDEQNKQSRPRPNASGRDSKGSSTPSTSSGSGTPRQTSSSAATSSSINPRGGSGMGSNITTGVVPLEGITNRARTLGSLDPMAAMKAEEQRQLLLDSIDDNNDDDQSTSSTSLLRRSKKDKKRKEKKRDRDKSSKKKKEKSSKKSKSKQSSSSSRSRGRSEETASSGSDSDVVASSRSSATSTSVNTTEPDNKRHRNK